MKFQPIMPFKRQCDGWRPVPSHRPTLRFEHKPAPTTRLHQCKVLSPTVQEFMAFVGQDVQDLDASFGNADLYEDKSLFKAAGPV